MRWPWVRRDELDRAWASRAEELCLARAEITHLREIIERMTDNALHAAGSSPVFRPEAERFQVRSVESQARANAAPIPLSLAEWRRTAEHLDLETAERDRKARFAEELKRIAQERNTHGTNA